MINVDFVCNPYGSTGYDFHSRALFKALDKVVNVKIPPIGSHVNILNKEDSLYFASKLRTPNDPAAHVVIHFQAPAFWKPVPGIKNIGVFSWETNKIPCRNVVIPNGGNPELFNWANQCRLMDEIWTFSKLSQTAITNSGYKGKVRVISGPFDFDSWSKEFTEVPIINVTNHANGNVINNIDRKFVISTIGEWSERKDFESLIKIVSVALPHHDCVLVIKTHTSNPNEGYIANEISRIKQSLKLPNIMPIVLLDKLSDESLIKTIIKKSDVYLTTSKGEGMNFPLMEAMAMGKLCIAGSNGAHSDYLNVANSIPVSCTPEVVIFRNNDGYIHSINYSSDQVWSKPNEIEIIMNLQKIYQEFQKDKELKTFNTIKANAVKTIKERFSLSQCGKEAHKYLCELTGLN